MRAADMINSQCWLITDEALEVIMAIAERTTDVEALVSRAGKPLGNARRVAMHDGTAVIPIVGPIMRYANLFSDISGATSTELLARDFRTALDDPSVDSIVLNIDSPGGTAAGINELSDMVFAARGQKPIIAYAGGQMQSAAYWIGSSADEIVVDRIAIIGSIGARISVTDTSARDARAGIRNIEIVSSQSPNKLIDPTMDEGRAKLQKIVDDLASVFVSSVARNLNVEASAVIADFGQGGSMVGQAAVDAGMAHRTGSLESLLLSLDQNRSQKRVYSMSIKKGLITISTTEQLRAALAAGHVGEEITLESTDLTKVKADAFEAGKAAAEATAKTELTAAVDAAKAEATTAERNRVISLQGIAAKGHEAQIEEAIKSGATAEATAVAIISKQKENGTNIDSQRRDASNAMEHGGTRQTEASDGSGWGKITSRFKKAKG